MKLDIGCGANPLDGFVGVDLFVVGSGLVKAPMWELPFLDNTIEAIFSSHALEHVPKRMVVPTLTEWRRVLQPGGTCQIQVPDLEWCCRQWLEHKSNDWWMDTIFGNQDHQGEFHLTGFTREIMYGYLKEAGWTGKVETCEIDSHRQNTLVFEVSK